MDTSIVYFLVAVPVLLGALSGSSSIYLARSLLTLTAPEERVAGKHRVARIPDGDAHGLIFRLPLSRPPIFRLRAEPSRRDEGKRSRRSLRAAVAEGRLRREGAGGLPCWKSPDKSFGISDEQLSG